MTTLPPNGPAPDPDPGIRELLGLNPDAGSDEVRAAVSDLVARADSSSDDAPATLSVDNATTTASASRPWWSRLLPFAAIAAISAVVVIVYLAGKPPAPGVDTAPPTAPGIGTTDNAPLDSAHVAELRAQLAANPNDVDAMRALAETYFDAAQFGEAAEWYGEVVAAQPEDIPGRLALGLSHFYSDDLAGAEQEWRTVTELDPANVSAYFNLGFLYLSTDPPNVTTAEEVWSKVVELAPGSDMAAMVEAHLDALRSSEGTG